MILDLPVLTEEEYNKAFEDFYIKPNKPEIEIQLQEFQKRLLVKKDYTVLPAFKRSLAEYSKSLLLKCLKGSTDYIEPEQVEVLANISAENFIKRYFRTENCVVGASFAGILKFKVREVLSLFFKQGAVESNLSIDSIFGNSDDSRSNLSVESLLSFQLFQSQVMDELSDSTIENFKEIIWNKITKELELLRQLNTFKNLDVIFLKYIIYLYILQKSRYTKKLPLLSKQALKLIEPDEDVLVRLTPIMESALLDVQFT